MTLRAVASREEATVLLYKPWHAVCIVICIHLA